MSLISLTIDKAIENAINELQRRVDSFTPVSDDISEEERFLDVLKKLKQLSSQAIIDVPIPWVELLKQALEIASVTKQVITLESLYSTFIPSFQNMDVCAEEKKALYFPSALNFFIDQIKDLFLSNPNKYQSSCGDEVLVRINNSPRFVLSSTKFFLNICTFSTEEFLQTSEFISFTSQLDITVYRQNLTLHILPNKLLIQGMPVPKKDDEEYICVTNSFSSECAFTPLYYTDTIPSGVWHIKFKNLTDEEVHDFVIRNVQKMKRQFNMDENIKNVSVSFPFILKDYFWHRDFFKFTDKILQKPFASSVIANTGFEWKIDLLN